MISCLVYVNPFKDLEAYSVCSSHAIMLFIFRTILPSSNFARLLHRSKPLEDHIKEQYRDAKTAQILEAFDEGMCDDSDLIYNDFFWCKIFLPCMKGSIS